MEAENCCPQLEKGQYNKEGISPVEVHDHFHLAWVIQGRGVIPMSYLALVFGVAEPPPRPELANSEYRTRAL